MTHTRPTDEYNLWDHYLLALRSGGNFTGRSNRREYWGYLFFYTLFFLAWSVLCRTIGGVYQDTMIAFYQLLFFIPATALLFRRLHDTGRSGWYLLPLWLLVAVAILLQAKVYTPYDSMTVALYLFGVFSAIGSLCLFIIAGFFRSDPGLNEYGPDPWRSRHIAKSRRMHTVEI
ncbi:DUF805 domain-containing protein [Oxalobacter vibrioformis]|uniref:DUF805 domain-containing protein n=1 Tax=Oxalobacter vibrioformis TaxID=933080 RepID=A0A9E9LW34_9BURK|nr:DUF805 domain-containing protein [Oxalobacter vibrioformis]WAW10296.1 DUF805 domain-containing protein [Oxalobacter vibrioformis]